MNEVSSGHQTPFVSLPVSLSLRKIMAMRRQPCFLPVKHFLRQITSHKSGEIRWIGRTFLRLSDLFNPLQPSPCELSLRKPGKKFKCPPSPAVPFVGLPTVTQWRDLTLKKKTQPDERFSSIFKVVHPRQFLATSSCTLSRHISTWTPSFL